MSTVDFTGTDPATALDRAEALYRAKGAVCRVQTYDFNDLDGLLKNRDYQQSEATLTMVKTIQARPCPTDTVQYHSNEPAWQEVYLGAITENRRAVNTRILTTIPEPRAFFGCHRDGRLISTALSVIGFGCAVIECVATRADARRQGGAEATLHALEAWAATQAATNRFWVKG